jgi:NIMA (never in mitosis gene a)-related kinase
VYAWGRGDSGRLGLKPDNLVKKRNGIPSSAIPRPVFGALHSVTSIDCRHWNAIIVAGMN